MRTLLLVFTLMILPFAAVHAQGEETDTEMLVVQEIIPGLTSTDAVTPLEAFGTIESFGLSGREGGVLDGFSLSAQGNLALLRQEGYGNEALLEQSGAGNLAVLLQLGNSNVAAAQQVGTGNVFGVRFSGSGNQLGTPLNPGVVQEGTGNTYLLDYTGNNRAIAPTTQVGVANQVVQIGGVAVPFGVEQYGNGMRMIIRHNGAEQ